MSDNGTRLPIIEALIMSSPEPLPVRKISELIEDVVASEIDQMVSRLNEKYEDNGMSFRIRKVAGGYQIYIIEDFAGYVDELLTRRRNTRLTRSALETLAIIAYRQPVTKLDIELIRGVASDSVIHTLLERKLVTLAGRAQTMGRPLLYRTTDEFLKYFNLNTLDDLPKMEEIEELVSSREVDIQPLLPFETADKISPDDLKVNTQNETAGGSGSGNLVAEEDRVEEIENSDSKESEDDQVREEVFSALSESEEQ